MTMPFHKYRPYPNVELADRTWPDKRITTAPIWTSVDLRDGNQALDPPMDVKRKRRMFELLVHDVGLKEIEVGFPSAAKAEFDFMRMLVTDELVPDDVTIMVLTQARKELIDRTFESLDGLPRAIVHLYNSTSATQRRVVFRMDREGIKKIAVDGAKRCRELAEQRPDQDIRFEYSPESFTATEPEYALEVCEAVMDVFEPTPERKLILNLPATVELSTPNLYADVIEWFCRSVSRRDSVIVSLHPHNDRGTAVAATELALMAGADRVEGTLFGNGERTGNVDLVTLALNLMVQGVDPGLDFSRINHVRKEVEHCNRMPVGERHPYVGDLVYTAFSGSHQDAIKKGMEALRSATDGDGVWDVPYLPFDPVDIGRNYDDAVRVNSQSGKGGVAYIMRAEHDLELPRLLQIEFTRAVQREVDESNEEISAEQLIKLFRREYMDLRMVRLVSHKIVSDDADHLSALTAKLAYQHRTPVAIQGSGNGTISAFVNALEGLLAVRIKVRDFAQQTLSDGTDAKAISYVKLSIGDDTTWGVGEDTDTAKASFDAILSAVSRVPQAWERLDAQPVTTTAQADPHKDAFKKAVESYYSDEDLAPEDLLRTVRADTRARRRATVRHHRVTSDDSGTTWRLEATLQVGDGEQRIAGEGNGTVSAFVDALVTWLGIEIEVRDYSQQTLSEGTAARAISYMWVTVDGEASLGVDEHSDTVTANFNAILTAVSGVPRAWTRVAPVPAAS
ncbi:MAG: 2-isopropylmalate synthase [Solirubrobacteraceae bacterium]|nr:2-isopropylmalate synthase [Solirubrobacteraceae bacterium]